VQVSAQAARYVHTTRRPLAYHASTCAAIRASIAARLSFMVGPWHDAGWLYWEGYGMPLAWACWDAARTIAPDYPGMKDVAEMEGALGRKYPEFF
jgi:hypothetical protein